MTDKKNAEDIQQVDTIELGLWIRNTIDKWDNETGMELYEYLAEEMKKDFTVIIQTGCADPHCNCDDLG